MANSDELFPIERWKEDDGQEIGCNGDDLARAIEIWVHAQQVDGVKVGDAALAFKVTPQKICEVFEARGNPFFWVEKSPNPHAERTFEQDGY